MDYKYLKELEGSLKEIIESPEIADKKFYQALKDLIDLKMNIEEFNHKFDQIGDVMTAMARGEFNQRVDIPISRNLFSFIGTSLNSVIDELERNVISISFVETLLETQPLPAIITNVKGIILFGNKSAHTLTNYPAKNLSQLIVRNLFVNQADFTDVETMEIQERKKVTLRLYHKTDTVDVWLSVQKIFNKHGDVEGYIYLFE